MHNWYGIETEVEFRRQEWQRAIAADARAAQALDGRAGRRIFRLPHMSLARLRALGAPRQPFASPVAPRRAAAFPTK
jgi:hypothetical protein